MIFRAALMALLLQASPAPQQTAAKATVGGVVLNGGTGEPLASVRVTLARTDLPLGPFAQMVAADRPPFEMTFSADTLALLSNEMSAAIREGTAPEAVAQEAALKALPISEIYELILGAAGSAAVVPRSSPPVLTDERGLFLFNGVEPGVYRLIFDSAGFSKRDFGQRTDAGEGVPLALTPGQTKTDIVMRLMPVGAISGRIRDAAGQPAAGVPVQLLRFQYDESGKRSMRPAAATQTDDRGDYRMFYLSPGRYYLNVGNQAGSTRPEDAPGAAPGLDGLLFGGVYFTPNRIPQNYALTYYPGTGDARSASAIDLQPGTDLRNIDLQVDGQKPHRVRGRVVDPASGRPPQSVEIAVVVETADRDPRAMILAMGLVGNARYNSADGTFELTNVASGSYSITATVPMRSPANPPDMSVLSPAERSAVFRTQMEEQRAQPRASTIVTVANADIEGVLLTLARGSAIPGRFRIEPNVGSASVKWEFLRAWLNSPTMGMLNSVESLPQPTAADGTFRVPNLLPGEYSLSVVGLPPGFYVKEARLGDADVLNAPVHLSGPTSNMLDIVVSPNVGTIEGMAVDVSGQPVPGAQVVLIPNHNRRRPELFRPVAADSTGHFAIPSIAPGEYTLAAWDAIEPFAYFDPELIAQAERQGKPIRLTESSNQSVNATTITARGR
jgi:5-hydroxyisourate hydrolase-like protein (transthyretin family)